MRTVIQRVSEASVAVDGTTIGSIGDGLVVLVCAMHEDSAPENAGKPALLARKIANLRVFRDDDGRMNRSLLDTGGAALLISQFTLAADTSRGNRPGFSAAAPPAEGARLYEAFADHLRQLGVRVETGRFGADMRVALVNDGPVTVWVEV